MTLPIQEHPPPSRLDLLRCGGVVDERNLCSRPYIERLFHIHQSVSPFVSLNKINMHCYMKVLL
jgi:hypothetical protein